MSMNNLDGKIKKIISELFECDISELMDTMGPGDIPRWDSLGHLTLMMEIQKIFGKKVPLDKALEVKSIADLTALIECLYMK